MQSITARDQYMTKLINHAIDKILENNFSSRYNHETYYKNHKEKMQSAHYLLDILSLLYQYIDSTLHTDHEVRSKDKDLIYSSFKKYINPSYHLIVSYLSPKPKIKP